MTEYLARTRAAWISFGTLGLILLALLVFWTPWDPVGPGAPEIDPQINGDFTPTEIARTAAYRAAIIWPGYISWGIGIVVITLLGFTSWGARLVGFFVRQKTPAWARSIIGAVVLSAAILLVTLPFDAWAEIVQRKYGLSTQSWGGWLLDVGLGFVVTAVVTAIILTGAGVLARRWPRRWWIPAAALAAALTIAGTYIWPMVVEPMFNSFTPLAAGRMRTSLVNLAKADGVPVSEVLVADASRRTTALNAYVSGLGNSRRLVVYDTLLAEAKPAEVRSVVAHELAHVRNNDVARGAAMACLGAAAGAIGLFLVLDIGRVRRRAGLTSELTSGSPSELTAGRASAGDPRAVALMLAVVTLGGVLVSPVSNLVSRRVETRADMQAIDLTEDPVTFARMQRRLAVVNLSDLSPAAVSYVLFATHPTAPERIAMARSWSVLHGMSPFDSLKG